MFENLKNAKCWLVCSIQGCFPPPCLLASQPPAPEWGYMLYEGKSYMQTAPWIMIFAGLAIFITVVVFNLLGDSLRDILDPKEE